MRTRLPGADPYVDIHQLDLDVAIYRDRVQVTHRATGAFIDQRAEYPFSDDHKLIAEPRFLEDTMVRAIRKIVQQGGFSLRAPIAHVIACDGAVDAGDQNAIRHCLRETGMTDVIFELDLS